MPFSALFGLSQSPLAWFSRRERHSRRLLSQIQMPLGTGVAVRDSQRRVLLCNAALLDMFALTRGIPPNGKFRDYLPSEVASFLSGLDKAALATRAPAVAVLPRGSAPRNPRATYRVATTPVFRPDGSLDGLVTTLVDQSDLHLAEQDAYHAQQRTRLMFDALPIPAAVLHCSYGDDGALDVRLVECNRACMEAVGNFGMPFGVSVSSTWPVFREVELLEKMAKLMAGGPVVKHEFFSGILGRQFELTISRYETGHALAFLTDLTELRQSQDQVFRLHSQMRGNLAETQRRADALLSDANQFMHVAVERLDEQVSALIELAGQLEPPHHDRLRAVTGRAQAVSEQLLRYAGVGLLPHEAPKLVNLQQVFEELGQDLLQRYPHITFRCEALPSLMLYEHALRTAAGSLLELVCAGGRGAGQLQIVVKAIPDFAETSMSLEVSGIDIEPYAAALGGAMEVDADWSYCSSLRLAVIRRVLTQFRRRLTLSRAGPAGLRFVLKSTDFQPPS